MLSTYLSAANMSLIPALAINFLVARLLFMWGYKQPENTKRAYGFAMGFLTNVLVLAFIGFRFVTEMVLGM